MKKYVFIGQVDASDCEMESQWLEIQFPPSKIYAFGGFKYQLSLQTMPSW